MRTKEKMVEEVAIDLITKSITKDETEKLFTHQKNGITFFDAIVASTPTHNWTREDVQFAIVQELRARPNIFV